METITRAELTFPNADPIMMSLNPNSRITQRNVPRGSTLRFVSEARSSRANCRGLTADTQNDLDTQVIVLSNGQRIPGYEPFDNQQKIQDFLTPEELPAGDNVISLPTNRRAILFELGVPYSRKNSPAYDFQDVVIVVDLQPGPITRSFNQAINSSQSQDSSAI